MRFFTPYFLLSLFLATPAMAKSCREIYCEAEAQIRGERAIPAPPASPTIVWGTGGKYARATPAEQQRIETVLKEVDGLLGSFLTPSSKIKIDAFRKSHHASYGMDAKMHELRLGVRNIEVIDKPNTGNGKAWGMKHPFYSEAIWVHEYAHAYFADFAEPLMLEMTGKFIQRHRPPHLTIARDRLVKEAEVMEKELSALHDFMEQWHNEIPGESPVLTELFEQHQRLEDNLDALNDRIELADNALIGATPNYYLKFSHFKTGMNEVFADAVAVTRSGDPEAMYSALQMAGDKDAISKASAEARSFSRRSLREWSVEDVHEMLSPTRVELGKYLPKPGAPATRKQEFLRKIVEIMKKEMASWAEIDLDSMTVRSVNQSLKKRIDAEFSDWR